MIVITCPRCDGVGTTPPTLTGAQMRYWRIAACAPPPVTCPACIGCGRVRVSEDHIPIYNPVPRDVLEASDISDVAHHPTGPSGIAH